MGGGLMQLVAYGAQDVYLTGNPQITFFKVVYRRHTNFAVEAITQTFNGSPSLGAKSTVQITRNGDLVTKMYLKVTCACELAPAVNDIDFGYSLINSVELQIGGTKIDKHYGHWMSVWSDLSLPVSKRRAHDNMIGVAPAGADPRTAMNNNGLVRFVPLQFFCCRNDGLALPLIALQYHDVRLEFEFASAPTLTNVISITTAELLVDYIYLDSEERKRFAQASHEYLIEQLQFSQESCGVSATNKFRLNFNHPVKELIWTINNSGAHHILVNNIMTSAILKLNGHDRFESQPTGYFSQVQPFQHHTSSSDNDGVYVYSFALNPEEHQPSGSCNFSRIDNAELSVVTDDTPCTGCNVYAVNYNVLRIMSGMGGLAYSN